MLTPIFVVCRLTKPGIEPESITLVADNLSKFPRNSKSKIELTKLNLGSKEIYFGTLWSGVYNVVIKE